MITLQKFMEEVRDSFLNSDGFPYIIEDINNGFCADFAQLIWEKFPSVHILSDDDMTGGEYSHTFFEFEDKYYDAECIEGIDDWTQLPTFLR